MARDSIKKREVIKMENFLGDIHSLAKEGTAPDSPLFTGLQRLAR